MHSDITLCTTQFSYLLVISDIKTKSPQKHLGMESATLKKLIFADILSTNMLLVFLCRIPVLATLSGSSIQWAYRTQGFTWTTLGVAFLLNFLQIGCSYRLLLVSPVVSIFFLKLSYSVWNWRDYFQGRNLSSQDIKELNIFRLVRSRRAWRNYNCGQCAISLRPATQLCG